MRFDWKRFLDQYKLPYVTSGPNVARGHLGIRCPYCGTLDPSEHMGLKRDASDPVWGCFRNATHRGRNPRRLVQRLLNCTFEQSIAIVELQAARVDDFDQLVDALHKIPLTSPVVINKGSIVLPKECRPLRYDGTQFTGKFIEYLIGRGFTFAEVVDLVEIYDIHYALHGVQGHRVVFPIRKNGQLLSWAGRAITRAELRYKNKEETDKNLLFNYDVAVAKMLDCPMLVMVEGPVDTVKVDYFGYDAGATAVGVLGTAVPDLQLAELATLLKGFECGLMLLDADAAVLNMQLADQLRELTNIPVRAHFLTADVGDPGKMTREQVQRMVKMQRLILQ